MALSWLGVHAVLTGAAFEQPTAIPLPSAKADDPPHSATPTPEQHSAAQSTSPSPTTTPTTTTTTTTGAPHGPAPASTATPPGRRPAPTTPPAAATATSAVKSYPVPGGKVALDLRDDRAALVSATPDPGWQMKVWNLEGWLRVDFVRGDEANSVIASWNGHPPIVETVVR
ncbi:hypothetical protein ACFRAR_06305 [Kitasatospora sp. NPDC056651]|uniref:hypothetical protein n=1 Tax=Kitasatospora sp. NPDC056651 TaxID=3345892 RepID=UPI00369995AC